MNKLRAAVDKAAQDGHVMVSDPPAAISSVSRYTCSRCGRAVLGNYTVAYGSAIEGECTAYGSLKS